MNKRWLITIGIIVLALIVIGVLHENGMLNFEWSGLTMIFAALAGPYALVKSWLLKDKRTEELLQKQQVRKTTEIEHRKRTDAEINAREKRIQELNQEIQKSEKKVKEIEEKKQNVEKEVNGMSIKELQDEGIDLFGA